MGCFLVANSISALPFKAIGMQVSLRSMERQLPAIPWQMAQFQASLFYFLMMGTCAGQPERPRRPKAAGVP